jgi:integrase
MMKQRKQIKRVTGLIIRCTACYKDIQCDASAKDGCTHPPDKTKYRGIVILPNSGGKRISVTLKADNYEDAVKELIDVRRDVKNGVFRQEFFTGNSEDHQPLSLIDCMSMYIDYLSDIGVPDHQKKHNSESHIKTINVFLSTYLTFLTVMNINVKQFSVHSINSQLVGKYYTYLNERYESNYTFNHHVKAMRALIQFLIDKKGYKITNYFKEITLKTEQGTDSALSAVDFYDLLEVIMPIDSVKKIGRNTKRNMYRPWLADYFKLKAYTGRRDVEVANMKWKQLVVEEGIPIYIASPNHKVNKLKNNQKTKDIVMNYIPIIEELEQFLVEKGLDTKIGADEYIIAPHIKNRTQVKVSASKGFTFFFGKLGRTYFMELKSLRKSYITAEEIYKLSAKRTPAEHANDRITEKHYRDKRVIATFISKNRNQDKFVVFPKNERGSFLKTTPQNNTSNKKPPTPDAVSG